MAYNDNIARSQDVLRTQSPIHTILDEEGLATLVSTLKEELGGTQGSGGGDSGGGSNHTTASVSKTGNTATITVTDKNGKVTTATITDGKDGAQGANGKDGITPTITIGTVTTLDSTESATVTNSGTDTAVVLDFGIPKGDKGDKGDTTQGTSSGTTDYNSLINKPDLSVYATKDDLATNYMNKTDLASTYQPKGDYLTDTDLTSYATQSYVQNYVQQELGVIENGTY